MLPLKLNKVMGATGIHPRVATVNAVASSIATAPRVVDILCLLATVVALCLVVARVC